MVKSSPEGIESMEADERYVSSGGVEPEEEGWIELPLVPVDPIPSPTGAVSSWWPVWRWQPRWSPHRPHVWCCLPPWWYCWPPGWCWFSALLKCFFFKKLQTKVIELEMHFKINSCFHR